jgi:hypothetical protein
MRELQHAVVGATLAVIAFTTSVSADTMPAATTDPNAMQMSVPMECTDHLRGMKLEARAANGGVTLQITNSRSRYVTQLRHDLRSIGEMVEYHAKTGDSGAAIPPLRIAITNIPSGVRVMITPEQSQNVGLVRQLAMILQTAWEDSECSHAPAAT